MSDYTPDKWLLLKITHNEDVFYKVFGTWGGGYLNGDCWRINSGVESVEEDGDYYHLIGYSDSKYICHKDMYGIVGSSNYGVLDKFIESGAVEVVDKVKIIEVLNKIKVRG